MNEMEYVFEQGVKSTQKIVSSYLAMDLDDATKIQLIEAYFKASEKHRKTNKQ